MVAAVVLKNKNESLWNRIQIANLLQKEWDADISYLIIKELNLHNCFLSDKF